MLKLVNSFKALLISDIKVCSQQTGALLHTTSVVNQKWNPRSRGPQNFVKYNKKMYEPQLPDEKPRPAVSFDHHIHNQHDITLIPSSVHLSCRERHQVQPKEDVVRRELHPRNVNRRGYQADKFRSEERSRRHQAGITRGARVGREKPQRRVQEQFMGRRVILWQRTSLQRRSTSCESENRSRRVQALPLLPKTRRRRATRALLPGPSSYSWSANRQVDGQDEKEKDHKFIVVWHFFIQNKLTN